MMWLNRLFGVVLLSATCLAISSHTPLDLLAYPAYSVRLRPDYPIDNSSATRILIGEGDKPEQAENEVQIHAGIGLHDPEEENAGSFRSFLLRSSDNGQGYLCQVPQHQYLQSTDNKKEETGSKMQMTTEERIERHRLIEQEKRQAYERGVALLEPLKGTCLYYTQGWFTC